MRSPSVIVIGAGVGGIAAATHLAKHGARVTVVEKNSKPGGRCGQFSRDGHVFDTGPTLMVMPLVYEAEFDALGESLHDRLELRRVDPTYQLVFGDGSQLSLTSDLSRMREQLEDIEAGSFGGFLRYVEEGERHYRVGMEKLVNRDFRKLGDLLNTSNLGLLSQVRPLEHHYQHMRNFFSSPRLKAAFSFQDVYMGLSPFSAPATFSMMSYTELAHGVFYPKGGMHSVVKALVEIAENSGLTFRFNAPVERIDVSQERASGVILCDGAYLAADIIVANADLPYVYHDLLPRDGMNDRLERMQYSCSTISFFWGIDTKIDGLGPHTLFLSDDYRGNFDSIDHDLTLPKNPSLYIHAPSKLDPAMAPEGKDSLIAIVPVGHLNAANSQDWPALRDAARAEVFDRLASLGIPNLESHIQFEVNFTPLSWKKRYNLAFGATHGLSHNLSQLAYFRPDNQHPVYHNLYFVGASTRPGTGIPTALISGRLTAGRALEMMGV